MLDLVGTMFEPTEQTLIELTETIPTDDGFDGFS